MREIKIYNKAFHSVETNVTSNYLYIGGTIINEFQIDCYYAFNKKSFQVITKNEILRGNNAPAYPLLNIGFQIALESGVFSQREREEWATKFDRILSTEIKKQIISKRFKKAGIEYFNYSHETYELEYSAVFTKMVKVLPDAADLEMGEYLNKWEKEIIEENSYCKGNFKLINLEKK